MKKISLLITILLASQFVKAQITEPQRPITTAVPFMLIAADARAAGLGDQGVATPVDAYAQQWNPAKYAFSEAKQGFGFGYTPYLRELVDDINLGTLTYYNRINERSSFSGSLRYFGLGGVELRETADQQPREVEPNEFAVDLSYALRLSEQFSMAVTGKFIRSDLRIPSAGDASAANTFAADIHAFYQGEEKVYKDFNGRWRAGAGIKNIGPKISYEDGGLDNFIPTTFSIGGGFDFILDPANKIGVYLEANKLLVPTPQDDESVEEYTAQNEFNAIFSSWNDAPGGLSEEFKEIVWSLGAEYWYEDSFAIRAGYFYEAPEKGFRQYATLGFGFRYSTVMIDASYLFSTAQGVENPLEGTLRFSISFNLGDGTYSEF
ncbi:MAG: type IX secretion system outer membrane channel protein PorV [Bacteroidota bacterium]